MTNIVSYNKTPDTNRGPSPLIWGDCPWLEIEAQVAQGSGGVSFFDDFVTVPKRLTNVADTAVQNGPYQQFLSDGSTVLPVAGEGGAVILNSSASNEAAIMKLGGAAFNLATGKKKLWFEARVKFGTIANDQNGVFLGLYENVDMTATVPIAADGTLAAEVFAGFYKFEEDGDGLDLVHSDGSTATTLKADATTLVADTYYKLGMVFEDEVITFYNNATAYTDTLTVGATEYPDAATVSPVIAILGEATEATGVTMDWWRVAQLVE
jgi:hypothetical protein